MRRAGSHHPAPGRPSLRMAGTITLAAADRHRRRVTLTDDQGRDFLLDLPRAVQMRDGDVLELDDGDGLRVVAADEEVMDVHCRDAAELARLAWHVGNRHVPVQILPECGLRVGLDHVLLALLEAQGAPVTRRRAPFQPEPGAYDPHGLMDAPPPLVRRA